MQDRLGEFHLADTDNSSTLNIKELTTACQAYLEVAGAKRQIPGTDSGSFRLPEVGAGDDLWLAGWRILTLL